MSTNQPQHIVLMTYAMVWMVD